VDELWDELRRASPSAELVTEGRIVAAGSLADRGDLPGAITLLAKGFRFPRQPADHHLRRAYALADLYERSGDLPQARQLFGRLAAAEPDFVDVEERLEALG
jgi:tetratricopeptide (TPR) repeat protein